MEITINIKAPDLVQAMLALAGAFSTQAASASASTPAPASASATPAQSEKPKRERRAPQQEGPEQPTREEDPAQTPNDTAQIDIPSVVDLRAKAQAVGTTPEAKKAIKALLDQFGAKSISDVPEDKRADFLAELDLV